MGEGQFQELITQDFLENALGRKVDKFVVTSGSKAGDNYSSTMYSIEVHFSKIDSELNKNETETAYLIAKCFPNHPARQKMLIDMNFFHNELSFYKVFVSELMKMQHDLQLENIIQPPFPTVVAGDAINFDEEKMEVGQVYKPFDNYIIMVDLRKTSGFRLAGRFNGFNWAHSTLVVDAIAKNHALGWAYKQKHNILNIHSKYPFLNNEPSLRGMKELLTGLLAKSGGLSYDIVKSELGEQSPVTMGTKKFWENGAEFFSITYDGRSHFEYEKYMRIAPEISEANHNEIPWKVVNHGDCWTNNMLFRYNEVTGEPEDVILLDLQCVREACPTVDLVYMIYLSTDSEFRKEHLDKLLDVYTEKFIHYCQMLKTEPLPGFCSQELKRRFHQSKFFAFCTALFGLPIILSDKEIDPKDLEIIEEGKNVTDMLTSFCAASEDKDSTLKRRVVGVCQDMYDDGII